MGRLMSRLMGRLVGRLKGRLLPLGAHANGLLHTVCLQHSLTNIHAIGTKGNHNPKNNDRNSKNKHI